MDFDGPEDEENDGTNGTNGDGAMMNGNGIGHEHDTIHEEIAA
jgi:hypothetical protein